MNMLDAVGFGTLQQDMKVYFDEAVDGDDEYERLEPHDRGPRPEAATEHSFTREVRQFTVTNLNSYGFLARLIWWFLKP